MTRYNLHSPDWLWDAYKTTVNGDQNLDEPLLKHTAERVIQCDDVNPELSERAEQFLEVQSWE